MNLENIKLNYPYRYADLCYAVGEEPVGGKSRIVQFNKWRKHFEYETQGTTTDKRYIVTKIYKQVEINTRYEVEDKIFQTLTEAEEYRKSL